MKNQQNRQQPDVIQFLLESGIQIPNEWGVQRTPECGHQMYERIPADKEIVMCEFANCLTINNIRIRDSVKKIGVSAFANCEKLQNIVFSCSLEEIGDGAFRACDNIKSINIPGSVLIMGNCVFARCFNLEKVTFDGYVDMLGDSIFAGCENLKEIIAPAKMAEKLKKDADRLGINPNCKIIETPEKMDANQLADENDNNQIKRSSSVPSSSHQQRQRSSSVPSSSN